MNRATALGIVITFGTFDDAPACDEGEESYIWQTAIAEAHCNNKAYTTKSDYHGLGSTQAEALDNLMTEIEQDLRYVCECVEEDRKAGLWKVSK